jgi:hypothetical protein
MRKTGMSFKQIYKLTKRFFEKIEYKEKKNKQRGRPRKYKDEFIIAIFLYQTLKQYSYRNENILKLLLEKTGKYFNEKTKIKYSAT